MITAIASFIAFAAGVTIAMLFGASAKKEVAEEVAAVKFHVNAAEDRIRADVAAVLKKL